MDEKKTEDPDEPAKAPHPRRVDGSEEAAANEASDIEEEFATAPDVGV